MGLKKYIFSALVLIIAIAAYVFSIESGDYKIDIANNVILLPVAVWIVVPAILLFIASVLHILYYSFKQYLNNRSITKDKDALINLIKNNLSGTNTPYTFKSDTFKEVGNILNQLNISIDNSDFATENKTIDNLGHKILQVNSGEHTSLKEFKLSNDSVLVQQNNINKTKIDDNYCLDILNKVSNNPSDLVEAAFIQVLKTKSFTTIKKLLENIDLNKNMTIELLVTDASYEDQFTFTSSEIIKLIEKVELTREDYLYIAKKYTNRMSPDQIIKLFEDISSNYEEANEAYLYILFEYEMIDDIREIINNSQKDEYIPYKALLDLKDSGKQYNFDSICYLK